MERKESVTARIMELLGALPGVVRVARLDDEQRHRVVDLEARYEGMAALPVRNIGMRLLRNRDVCCALLKDARFRSPRIPTVYLVEEGAPEHAPHVNTIEDARYAIVGEEVVDGGVVYDEPTVPLDTSFVIFPERRTGVRVPCAFILPPVTFPELESEAGRLGITKILSISPSLAADAYLREAFRFPPTNELATLLIGCNLSPRADGG